MQRQHVAGRARESWLDYARTPPARRAVIAAEGSAETAETWLHHIALKLRNDQEHSRVLPDVGSLSSNRSLEADPVQISTLVRKGNGGASP
jgi:hypothetical protein